jgi:hypothetical protein
MVDDIDRVVEAVGKLGRSVVRAAAANSNRDSPIVTWPRTPSGFTSNCSAVHLLKRQPRVAGANRSDSLSGDRTLAYLNSFLWIEL